MAYTVKEKALAVAIMNRHGGMTVAALEMIREELGRLPSKSTLHDWLKQVEPNRTEPNEPAEPKRTHKKRITPQALEQAEEALDDKFERAAHTYLDHALRKEIVDQMKGKDAIIAAATATDKMRVLRNLPTEILGLLPSIMLKIQAAGIDPKDVFEALDKQLSEVNLN